MGPFSVVLVEGRGGLPRTLQTFDDHLMEKHPREEEGEEIGGDGVETKPRGLHKGRAIMLEKAVFPVRGRS